ncbi:MAG TPA: FHA domain-containing protein [Baekduia sp.]|nr:FHA domain-containing protein [Baekduia sp.]
MRPPRGARRLGDRLRLAVGRAVTGRASGDRMVLVLPIVAPGTQILLGRSRASDVRFLEPTVSRRHAALQRVDGGWLLVDRASTHGTFVNGRRVEHAILADGDEIALGGARMVVRV